MANQHTCCDSFSTVILRALCNAYLTQLPSSVVRRALTFWPKSSSPKTDFWNTQNNVLLHTQHQYPLHFFQENLDSCMSHSTLIITPYSLFQTIMTYGIIFCGSSSHSQKSFKIQKTAIRIIMRHKHWTLVETYSKN